MLLFIAFAVWLVISIESRLQGKNVSEQLTYIQVTWQDLCVGQVTLYSLGIAQCDGLSSQQLAGWVDLLWSSKSSLFLVTYVSGMKLVVVCMSESNENQFEDQFFLENFQGKERGASSLVVHVGCIQREALMRVILVPRIQQMKVLFVRQ